MRLSLIALTLVVQVCTVAVFFAFSGDDSQAYPMDAGYVIKDKDLDRVYYEGVPAQMTYDKMDVPAHLVKDSSAYFKKLKNLRCEQKEVDHQSAYRCAVDLSKLPHSGA